MKKKHTIVFWVLSFTLLGCQAVPDSGGRETQIALHLQLPASLAKGSPRFQHFFSRLDRLELEISTKKGFSAHHVFAPAGWDNLFLPGLDFPKGVDDVLTLTFKAWDRQGDGTPRSFACLTGTKKVKPEELAGGQVAQVPLRLSLNVPAADY